MTSLQEKIDAIISNLWQGIHTPMQGDYRQYNNQVQFKAEINKALQEFREQIKSLQTHRYKVGNDYFVGISFHRIMELIGEKK